MQTRLIQGRGLHGQVIGNVSLIIMLSPAGFPEVDDGMDTHSQLQQRKVGVAVVCPVLALLRDIILEDDGGFWIVPV